MTNNNRNELVGLGVIAKKGKLGVGAALKHALENLDELTTRCKETKIELESLQASQRGADLIEEIAQQGYDRHVAKRRSRLPWWPVACLGVCLPIATVLF